MSLIARVGPVCAVLLAMPAVAVAAPVALTGDGSGWFGLLVAIGSALFVATLIGGGIMPTGAIGTEVQVVTRRAMIQKAIVQIYQATPTVAAGLANAQTASGGVASVTVPVQGAAMTTAQAVGYDGTFTSPTTQAGISEASFNLKAIVVPIGFLGMEGIVQQGAAVIPLIEARMNDAGNQISAYLATQMFTNSTAGSLNPDGFPLIAATGNTYGNIDRTAAGNAFWQANVKTVTAGTAPTRLQMLTWIVSAMKASGGEMPNMGVLSPGTWTALAQDFVGQEQYRITPDNSFDMVTQGARSAFTALMVAGVPFYMDPFAVDGTLLLFNTRYLSYYIHEAAAFAFTGFASTIPNNVLGYVGVLVAVLEFLCVKPSSVSVVTGFAAQSGL